MRVRDEIRLAIGALLAVQIITSFAAIALLSRMSPAVERILEENVFSITAVEEMLAEMAEAHGDPMDAGERAVFESALERAQNNITEEEERPILKELSGLRGDVFAGEEAARRDATAALIELGKINRASMQQADEFAKQLGTAGAWAAVFLGMLGFTIGVLAGRRLTRQLLRPLSNLWATVEAYQAGDPHRRARVEDAPPEIEDVAETVNRLLDQRVEEKDPEGRKLSEIDRAVALHFLDEVEKPAVVVSPEGAIAASNGAARELLSGEESQEIRTRIARHFSDGETPEEHPFGRIEEIRGVAWLVELA